MISKIADRKASAGASVPAEALHSDCAVGGRDNRGDFIGFSAQRKEKKRRRVAEGGAPMNKQPSGFFDDENDDKPRITGKVKKRAEELAFREVGAFSDWPRFVEEAAGEVSWENFEKWQAEQGWKPVATFDYSAPDGRLLYQAVRFQYELFPSKKFILRHRIGNGKWIHDGGPVRVPYNLQEISKRSNDPITLVEGEDFSKAKGLLASCVQGQNWTNDVVKAFAGRIVNLAMDFDDAGRENAKKAITWLDKVKATVRVIKLPGAGPGDGLDDWLASHDVAEFEEIVARTKVELPTNGTIVAKPHNFPAEEAMPTWDFLYGKHRLRGTTSAVAAMGGAGKSTKMIAEALAMTTGRALLKVQVPRPLRVLYVNLEDNREAIDKRIAAAMKHYKITPEDVGGRLFTKAKGELIFKIAKLLPGGVVERNEAAIDGMSAFLIENQIDVLIIDPLIAAHSVKENDNDAMRDVIECFDTITAAANCEVTLAHHLRKGNGGETTIDSVRGGGAFVDACRSVRVLETMSKKEAEAFGLEHARSYFRSFSGKLTFAPPIEESDWYHFVNVDLSNSPSGEFMGDAVGVVEACDLKAKVTADLSMDDISNIKREIATSNGWREDIRAGMWVGKAIATALNLDVDEKKDKIKSILAKLIKDKVLKKVTRKARDRHEYIFVECA
jgi:hypothetical protein